MTVDLSYKLAYKTGRKAAVLAGVLAGPCGWSRASRNRTVKDNSTVECLKMADTHSFLFVNYILFRSLYTFYITQLSLFTSANAGM